MLQFAAVFFVLAGMSVPVEADEISYGSKVGETYEIVQSYKTEARGTDGSSSSSSGSDALLERVVNIRDGGVELEYALPEDVAEKAKRANWQFPVRVFRSRDGQIEILNIAELEARVDPWLKAGGMTRAACGQYVFTWNAFSIDCDPKTIVDGLRAQTVKWSEIQEGTEYKDERATESARLVRKGSELTAVMKLDARLVQQERAEGDVVVAKLMGKPLTPEEAVRGREKEVITGTIEANFSHDAPNLWRRTTITKLETRKADGETETETITNVLERRRITAHGSR